MHLSVPPTLPASAVLPPSSSSTAAPPLSIAKQHSSEEQDNSDKLHSMDSMQEKSIDRLAQNDDCSSFPSDADDQADMTLLPGWSPDQVGEDQTTLSVDEPAPFPSSIQYSHTSSLLSSFTPSLHRLAAFPPFSPKPHYLRHVHSQEQEREQEKEDPILPSTLVSLSNSSSLSHPFSSLSSHPQSSSSSASPSSPLQQDPLDHAAVLAARLRHERNHALASLHYSSLEHDIAVSTLESELRDLRTGRDALNQDLQQMVIKLIEGERAQKQLNEMTDALCQSESSYHQAKGRLDTAHAELQELRARLSKLEQVEKVERVDGLENIEQLEPRASHITSNNASSFPSSKTASPSPCCNCRTAVDDLRRENADLQDQLETQHRQNSGAANLVLSLQEDRDRAALQLDQSRSDLALQTERLQRLEEDSKHSLNAEKQRSKHFEHLLAIEQTKSSNLEATILELDDKSRAAERAHLDNVDNLQDALTSTRVQLQGAINRTLALQTQLDEQEEALSAEKAIKENMHIRAKDLESTILEQSQQLSSSSENVRALESEAHRLQSSLENLVLVHLQERHANAAVIQTQISQYPDRPSGSTHGTTISSLIIVLAQVAKQTRILKGSYNNAVSVTSPLRANLEQAEAQINTLQSHLHNLQEELTKTANLSETIASLQDQNSLLKLDLAESRQKTETAYLDTSTARSTIKELETVAAEKDDLLSQLRDELDVQRTKILELDRELTSTRESLRVAEEEGRNLVADFNMLSEELEHLQSEDETRSAHTADTARRLAEATAKEEELRAQRASDEAALADLQRRLQDLEADLERMQINVEETDDKYLSSLKTIKKQSTLLDKLKVRNEALSRANALLNRAIPSEEKSPLAPPPASARKRTMPTEFVAPDPGPAAIVAGSSSLRNPASHRQPAAESSRTSAHRVDVRSTQPDQIVHRSAAQCHNEAVNGPGLEASKTIVGNAAHNREKATLDMGRTAVSTQRAPLAPVASQKTMQALPLPSDKAGITRIKAAPASLASKAPFKPTSTLGIRVAPKPAASSDTRNLLAALHALKRPS